MQFKIYMFPVINLLVFSGNTSNGTTCCSSVAFQHPTLPNNCIR